MRRPPLRIEVRRWSQCQDVRVGRLQQPWQAGLRADETAARVDLMHQVKALHWRVQRAAQPDRTGVVDQDVQAAEGVHGRRDGSPHLLLVADVAPDRKCMTAGGLDLGSDAVDGARKPGIGDRRLGRDRDVGAVARRTQRNGATDAAGGTGDEQSLAR